VQMGQFFRAENWLLLGMDVIILIAALWVTFEAVIAMRGGRDPLVDVPTDEPLP